YGTCGCSRTGGKPIQGASAGGYGPKLRLSLRCRSECDRLAVGRYANRTNGFVQCDNLFSPVFNVRKVDVPRRAGALRRRRNRGLVLGFYRVCLVRFLLHGDREYRVPPVFKVLLTLSVSGSVRPECNLRPIRKPTGLVV